jgi:tRNA G10  N-methylase Trm11
MYFKGNFYKSIPKPKHIFDIEPIKPECKQGDARNLPFPNSSIYSMILDPPFIFGIHGKEGKHQKNYYSSSTHGIFTNLEELLEFYEAIIKEASRILMIGGKLFFKCQDYTDNKTTLTHCLVYNLCKKYGFIEKDLAILYLSKGKITNPNLKQRHLRKHHSYFFIFQRV